MLETRSIHITDRVQIPATEAIALPAVQSPSNPSEPLL